jgi:ethanolamine-phosphate cytidylyltransferase
VAAPGAKIVYIDGAFDLFHPGHVEVLKARADDVTPEWRR